MQQIFEEIDQKYHLGILDEPIPLSGGFMHKMYALRTKRGRFAVKLLTPHIMMREDAMANYAEAERLEQRLQDEGIPILPALSFDGKKMQEAAGQYFYLFDYFDGKPVMGKEITSYHCMEIGKALALIHGIDRKKSERNDARVMDIDWNFYIAEMKKENEELYRLLSENQELFVKSQNNGNRARKKLSAVLAVCHNDMDSKNVLWKGQTYRIIDLECLSYSHPEMELFELALCWSGYEECQMNFGLFDSFLKGYAENGGIQHTDWEVLYDCNNGRLEWLEYNIKRVLGIDCGSDEKEMGIGQVRETVRHVIFYDRIKEQLLEHCL